MTPTPQRRTIPDTLVPIARRNGMEAAARVYDAGMKVPAVAEKAT